MSNQFANPGYEIDTAGWVAAGSATITRVTTDARSGIACVEVATGSVGPGEGISYGVSSPPIPAQRDQDWTISMWAKGTGLVQLAIVERSSAGAGRGETVSPALTLNDTWQQLTVTRTFAHAETTRLTASLRTTSPQAVTFYVDDWFADYARNDAITLPILRLGSPHIGPLRAGKA